MSGPARRAKRVEGAGRRLGALAVAAALAAACGEGSPAGAPRPTSVTPAQGSQAIPVPVRIEGAFDAQVSSDFTGQGGVVDARFQAFLGDTALEDVALRQDGAIAATVPLGLAAGSHDLTVIGPDGRAGRLARAYQVLAYAATVAAVAGYRVDAVAAQVASGPFTVVVTAIDAAGAVVPDFAGSVTLSDLTATVVPREVGPFVAGRWTGTVEIRARHAADVLTVADAGGASGRSGPFPVGPAPVAAVRFDTPAAALTAGQCAGPLTLSIADAFGQPTTAGADTPLALAAAPSAGFALFDGAGCTTPIAAPAVAAGQGSVSLWIRATVAGPLALTAAAGAFPPAAQT